MNKLFSSVTLLIILPIVISCAVRSQRELSKKEVPIEPAETITMRSHESEFGFSIELSSRWTILSGQELKENPDLLEHKLEYIKKTVLRNADKNMMAQLKITLQSGGVEYYFHQDYPGVNINVTKEIGRIPQTHAELNVYCKRLPDLIAKILGISIKVHRCEQRNTGGLAATYTVLELLDEGHRIIQYQVPKSPNVKIIIGATCGKQYFEIIESEFDEIMESFELKKTGD